MKIAFLTDYLLGQDKATFMLEILINMFPDMPIMTLAHNKGSVTGPIEQRKIYSTFMSKLVKTPKDFVRKSFLVPSALKQLPIEEFDFVFCLSRGFCHNFELSKKQQSIVYFLEWNDALTNNSLGLSSIFKNFIEHFRSIANDNTKELCFSSKSVMQEANASGRVIAPFFDTSKFSFSERVESYYYLNSQNVKQGQLNVFRSVFQDLSIELIESGDNFDSLLAENSRAIIDLSKSEVPFGILSHLSLGKPVIMNDSYSNRDYFNSNHGVFLNEITYSEIKKLISDFDKKIDGLDRKKIRREALKYNGRIFKARVKEALASFQN